MGQILKLYSCGVWCALTFAQGNILHKPIQTGFLVSLFLKLFTPVLFHLLHIRRFS